MKCHNCNRGMDEVVKKEVHWCTRCGSISCARYGDMSPSLSGRVHQKLIEDFCSARRELLDLGLMAGIKDPEDIVY